MMNFIKRLFKKQSKPITNKPKQQPSGISFIFDTKTEKIKIICSCNPGHEVILAEILFKITNGSLYKEILNTLHSFPNAIMSNNIIHQWDLLSQTQNWLAEQPLVGPTDVFNNYETRNN